MTASRLPGDSPTLQGPQAALEAAAREDWPAALSYALKAIAEAPGQRSLTSELARLFADNKRFTDSEACWRTALEARPSLWARAGLAGCLDQAGDLERTAAVASEAVLASLPFEALSVTDQNHLVHLVRRLVQAQFRGSRDLGLAALGNALLAREPPSAMREWILSGIALARFDLDEALARIADGLETAPLDIGVALDLNAEAALIHARHNCYGEALEAIGRIEGSPPALDSFYGRRLEVVRRVADLCRGAPAPLRYPECLIDIVLAEIAATPIGYRPRRRELVMITASLGQGGGERQAVSVASRLHGDARVRRLSLFVRSTRLRLGDDFHLEAARALPIDLALYGEDWARKSDIAEALPELVGRERLLAALDLMPHNLREETVRLTRRLLDVRPAAVHIWQDLAAGALACVLAGVPTFVVARGSLALDARPQNAMQTETYYRPIRHIYRSILKRPEFILANNSEAGRRSDQAWLDWPDPHPFKVLHNAIDFAALGKESGRNLGMRRELGATDKVMVVGGAFRFSQVKRPMIWIEAARLIHEALPGTHFVIIGEGEMAEAVAAYADAHGFAEFVHLPGHVANVGDWYRAMDVLLMTSDREGIPNVLLEAQHFGVPVIATDVGGVSEAMEPGRTGRTVLLEAGAAGYADAVLKVLRDAKWRRTAQLGGPPFVHDKFSLPRVIDDLLSYLGMENV